MDWLVVHGWLVDNFNCQCRIVYACFRNMLSAGTGVRRGQPRRLGLRRNLPRHHYGVIHHAKTLPLRQNRPSTRCAVGRHSMPFVLAELPRPEVPEALVGRGDNGIVLLVSGVQGSQVGSVRLSFRHGSVHVREQVSRRRMCHVDHHGFQGTGRGGRGNQVVLGL